MTRQRPKAALYVFVAAASACAPRLASLPTGPGSPFSEYAAAYDQATVQCRGVRTLVGVMSLSGRAGRSRLRGQVEIGLAAPGMARLEAHGPFGSRPVFVFVARGESATLVLPRDRRVLEGESPEAIVEALAGVPLGPEELRSALSGCGLQGGVATGGRAFDQNWLAIDVGSTTQWLRQVDGVWRVVASARGPLAVRYSEFTSSRPVVVRLTHARGASGVDADLSIRLSQVDLNVPLEPSAFRLEIPSDAEPMTLEELRQAGPLGDRDQNSVLNPKR